MSEENKAEASATSGTASASSSSSSGTSSSSTGNTGSAGNAGAAPVFAIKRIFVRDLSFEMPSGLESFAISSAPKVAQDINTEIDSVDEQHFMVTLKMTVTVKVDDEKVAYLIEVHQSGVFQISGFSGDQVKHILTSQCPTILYPYIREAVDSVVIKAGFPPLALPPLNFDAILAKATAEARGRSAAAAAASASSDTVGNA